MRILIVGAGVAGLTLAAKLRQQGREPVVIDRANAFQAHGYGIGLFAFGASVLHGLGVYEELLASGMGMERYEMAAGNGTRLQRTDMSPLTRTVGPMVMTTRARLIELLHRAAGDLPVRSGLTVEALAQDGDGVDVTFSDGSRDRFDLVCGCDGIHSKVRALTQGQQPVYDLGWLAWTWWGPAGVFPPGLVREHWGRGLFFGVYPVPDRATYVAGLPADRSPAADAPSASVLPVLRTAFARLSAADPAVGRSLETGADLYAWRMSDVRARAWSVGRVVLCGDACTAFLPTAGLGASAALRGASVLADELSRTDAARVRIALELYEKRARRRIESLQGQSRLAGRVMLVRGRTAGWLRDRLLGLYPPSAFLGQLVSVVHQPL